MNTEPTAAVPAVALTSDECASLDAYWNAANYLSVGQIYLLGNPLLHEPLALAHIKPRLLGHWGTTPGLNFIYAHLNRAIVRHDRDVILVTGPGHGGPALVANTWLEGTYSELYAAVGMNAEGMARLFRQFSFPGGIGSHATPETPGSIHEGGELGYSLSHAYGAVLDNPNLIAACVVGDGEAETGPLAAAWHSNKFVNPATDGAVLPILHLNGYKIANPTVLARIPRRELEQLICGYGYRPYFVEGSEPSVMHEQMAATLDSVIAEIRTIQTAARRGDRRDSLAGHSLSFEAPKAGPARNSSMVSRLKVRGAPIRFRLVILARRIIFVSLKNGFEATDRTPSLVLTAFHAHTS